MRMWCVDADEDQKQRGVDVQRAACADVPCQQEKRSGEQQDVKLVDFRVEGVVRERSAAENQRDRDEAGDD